MNRSSRFLGWCLMGVLGLMPASGWAQATKPAAKKAPMDEKVLVTKDNARLHATYFPSAGGRNSPVVLLLHGKNGNRLIWQTGVGSIPGFALALQQNDYAVLSLDLRFQGQNIQPDGGAAPANKKSDSGKLTARDYVAMVGLDLEAAKKFLLDEHQAEKLNINKLAIVSADFSTALALAYTDLDWSKEPFDDAPILANRTPRGQDVRALILLSPDSSVPGVTTAGGVARARGLQMPVMIGVGNKDTLDRGAAKKLHDQLAPKRDKEGPQHVFLQEYESKLRGTDLLNKGLGVEPQMLKFLDEHLKKQPSEWRNRKSPLQD